MPSKSRGIFGSQEAFLNKFSMPDLVKYRLLYMYASNTQRVNAKSRLKYNDPFSSTERYLCNFILYSILFKVELVAHLFNYTPGLSDYGWNILLPAANDEGNNAKMRYIPIHNSVVATTVNQTSVTWI